MRKLSIEVHEDSGRPGGGHAVIRLMGLQSLPDNVTYRIRPVDTALQADQQLPWIESDRQPLATRITTEGAELVVGPEIVENPAFLPGTLAVIEVAKCGVRGEFLWPRIAPLIRPKRRHLITVKPHRQGSPEPETSIHFEEASDASSHIEPEAPPLEPAPLPAEQKLAIAAADAGDAVTTSVVEPVETSAKTAGTELQAAAIDPAASEAVSIAAAPSLRPASPPAAFPVVPQPSARNTWRTGTIAAAMAAFGLLAGATLLKDRTSPDPTIARGMRVAEAASLTQLITTGSPATSGDDTSKLLEQADARLHGPNATRDKAEAAGLLRRYLATTLGDERTLWALTQLGSVYAEPPSGNAPDYDNARRLWELSGSLGDPVAMCFVAALHEHGLGVRPDKETALSWYRQAKTAGGCRDADTAIARLKGKK